MRKCATEGFRHDPKRECLRLMLQRLDALGWERYDVLFPKSILAHEQIINKKHWVTGKHVAIHCAHIMSQELLSSSQLHILTKSDVVNVGEIGEEDSNRLSTEDELSDSDELSIEDDDDVDDPSADEEDNDTHENGK